MTYLPEILDEEQEAELDRLHQMRKRNAAAWQEEEYKEDFEHGDAVFG